MIKTTYSNAYDIFNKILKSYEITNTISATSTVINTNIYEYLYSSTNTNTYKYLYSSTIINKPKPTPSELMRQILAARHAPFFHRTRKIMTCTTDTAEIRARQTLRRIIGEKNYRRFLRDGFITIRARSGFVYRIFPGHGMTDVYKDGKPVDRLCVVLNGNFPPTDSLLMRYLLILNDEDEFSQLAIRHSVRHQTLPFKVPSLLTLPEQWAKLKVA